MDIKKINEQIARHKELATQWAQSDEEHGKLFLQGLGFDNTKESCFQHFCEIKSPQNLVWLKGAILEKEESSPSWWNEFLFYIEPSHYAVIRLFHFNGISMECYVAAFEGLLPEEMYNQDDAGMFHHTFDKALTEILAAENKAIKDHEEMCMIALRWFSKTRDYKKLFKLLAENVSNKERFSALCHQARDARFAFLWLADKPEKFQEL